MLGARLPFVSYIIVYVTLLYMTFYFVGRLIISEVSNRCENMNELVFKYKKP